MEREKSLKRSGRYTKRQSSLIEKGTLREVMNRKGCRRKREGGGKNKETGGRGKGGGLPGCFVCDFCWDSPNVKEVAPEIPIMESLSNVFRCCGAV